MQVEKEPEEKVPVPVGIRFERAITKFDNYNMILVGTEDEENWRRFQFGI